MFAENGRYETALAVKENDTCDEAAVALPVEIDSLKKSERPVVDTVPEQLAELVHDAAGTSQADTVVPSHRFSVTPAARTPAVSTAEEVMTYPAGTDTRRLQLVDVEIVYAAGMRIVMPAEVPSARLLTFGAVDVLHMA